MSMEVCEKCAHRKDCIVDGKPNEPSLQQKSDRVCGIFLPKGCPFKVSIKFEGKY